MKKKKIAHVQLLPLLSGVQIMMLNLLESLDRDKYEIYVISKPGGPLVDKVQELGYNYIPVTSLRRNLSPFLDVASFFKLIRIFRENRFDIVHTHSSKTGFLGRIAAKLAGTKKIIHTAHGFPFHDCQPLIAQNFYRLLEKIGSYFCHKVVVVNNFEREEAEKSYLISPKKLLTIHNGIRITDEDKTNKLKKPKDVKSFFRIHNVPVSIEHSSNNDVEDCFYIGTVARFTRAKNIVNLINIAVDVCRKSNRIIFLFIGDGELYEDCKKIVAESGMEKRIIMPGWQQNIQEWLDNINVFLLYSKWEGLSMSILEAMASGLPIVASNIKGNNELITKENGILVDVNDHNLLTEILLSLPERQEELLYWGRNSVKRVKEMFNYKKFVEAYKELYEQ